MTLWFLTEKREREREDEIWECTSKTCLSCFTSVKKLIINTRSPLTILTIRQSIFQVKWVVSKHLTTISTQEAFWMEMLANCIQAILWEERIIHGKTNSWCRKCNFTFTTALIFTTNLSYCLKFQWFPGICHLISSCISDQNCFN